MRFWIDLETTGLDPKTDCILEIAVLVTDDQLESVIQGPSLVVRPCGLFQYYDWSLMNPFVVEMHKKNGLLTELNSGLGLRRYEAEEEVIRWVQSHIPGEQLRKTPLAGSSVHFDRAFLKEHMPQLEKLFSHRDYDVSTLKMHAEAFDPGLTIPKPPEPAHRAKADILESLEAARFLRDYQWASRKAA